MQIVGHEIEKAIEQGDQADAILLLKQHPIEAGWENENQQSLYWTAALYGRTDVLHELSLPPYAEYVDIWAVDRWYQSPIEMARRAGHQSAVKVIQAAQKNEIAPTMQQTANTSLNEWIQEIALPFFAGKTRYAFAAATLAAAVIFFGVFAISTIDNKLGDEPRIREILAGAGDNGLVEAVIAQSQGDTALKSRHPKIIERLASAGWTLAISAERDVALNADPPAERLDCSVKITGANSEYERQIRADFKSAEPPEISSNFYDFPEELAPFKNDILEIAILTCF